MGKNTLKLDGKLFLHSPDNPNSLGNQYRHAFSQAQELFVVTAYLTEWDKKLKLNPKCEKLRIIAGKDFGLTRKSACKSVLKWLPKNLKSEFFIASKISGFHPKAIFWKEASGKSFAVIGSSNLTNAAFNKNYEANAISTLSSAEFVEAKRWLSSIEASCETVSPSWLAKYVEARLPPRPSRKQTSVAADSAEPLHGLPRPPKLKAWLDKRRTELKSFNAHSAGLRRLLRRCADGKLTSLEFYDELPNYWSHELGDRLQGKGYTIKGKHSDFAAFSRSLLAVVDASDTDRDDIVSCEIDKLAKSRVPTRRALFSEMLCLFFPAKYPVLNTPVIKFRSANKLRRNTGASEGEDYIYLARTLRNLLQSAKKFPARNLAELDIMIWLKHDPNAKYASP